MLVSNASTLILLAKVSALSTFLQDIKEVAIPKIVHDELLNKDSLDALIIKKEIEKKRIRTKDVKKETYASLLNQFRLHEGEAAAYALFKQEKGKAILTDDGELIKLCKLEGIPFITSMASVVQLFKKKKLSKEEALGKLVALYHHGWYTQEIYEYFKKEVN